MRKATTAFLVLSQAQRSAFTGLMSETKSRRTTQQLLFGKPDTSPLDDIEEDLEDLDADNRKNHGKRRVSAYVDVFEGSCFYFAHQSMCLTGMNPDVISTVLEGEIHLLSPDEVAIFKHISNLDCR